MLGIKSRLSYGLYWTVPALAAAVWFAELVAMLAIWARRGHPDYNRGDVTIPFVSDMFAFSKTLVIIMSSITAGLFVLSLFLERWLRHVDRIPGTIHSRQRTYDIIAIVLGCIGAAGLVVLSVFDDQNHSNVHWAAALFFIVFVALSALFQLLEVSSLSQDHPDRYHLRRNGYAKIVIVTLAVAVAISFGGSYASCGGRAPPYPGKRAACSSITSAAAGLEWTDAFIIVLFFISLAFDMWPAAKSSPRYLRRHPDYHSSHAHPGDKDGHLLHNGQHSPAHSDPYGRPSYGGQSVATNGADSLPAMRQIV